jgi:hypothetical protein
MKALLPFVLFVFLLEGCFIVKLGNSPAWDNHPENDYECGAKDTLCLSFAIKKGFTMVPLPPFFIFAFDKKMYAMDVRVESKKNLFSSLDSIHYVITDSKHEIRAEGTCSDTSTSFRHYYANMPYEIFINDLSTETLFTAPKSGWSNTLDVLLVIYLHDPAGRQKSLEYRESVEPIRYGRGIIPLMD